MCPESAAPVGVENFNIVNKSKLKGNSSVTMVEDTTMKTSQFNSGIQKRKQKSPVKVRTDFTLAINCFRFMVHLVRA